MAMKYHPDRNKSDKNAESKFKEVNQAYDTLSDTNKKKQYDMF
jgi:DnaJ-class molecular chaperone